MFLSVHTSNKRTTHHKNIVFFYFSIFLFLSFTSYFLKEMTAYNYSTVTEFVLAGLTAQPELQLPLFLLFLVIYGVTAVGNLGMILLISLSSNLQSPMYFFLSNLSFLDLFYSSVVTPKLLRNFMWE